MTRANFQNLSKIASGVLFTIFFLSNTHLSIAQEPIMKKPILLLGISLLLGCVSAAQTDPFLRAQNLYQSEFPLAEAEEWTKFDEGYVVSFYDRASERAVEMRFDHKGRWRETTLSLETENLSQAIQAYVAERFDQYYATAYELRKKRKQPYFGLVVDTPTHIHTLLFRQNGSLIEQYSEGVDGS